MQSEVRCEPRKCRQRGEFTPNRFDHRGDGTTVLFLERKNREPLTCLIDTSDFDSVSGHRWHALEQNTIYAYTTIRKPSGARTSLLLHRLLLPTVNDVHHINRIGLDNRRQNLRPATRSQNLANTRKRVDAISSTYRGVSATKSGNNFRARIQDTMLGVFKTETEAALAYNVSAKERFGPFASLNQVPESIATITNFSL